MSGESPLNMMRPPEPRLRRPGACRRRRGSRPILAAGGAVIVLAAGWVGLWYYRRLGRRPHARRLGGARSRRRPRLFLRLAVHRRVPAPHRGPLRRRRGHRSKACRRHLPSSGEGIDLHGRRSGPDPAGRRRRRPLTLADLGQPPSFTADWSRARLTVRGVPPKPDSVAVAVDAAHSTGSATQPATIFTAERADLQGHHRVRHGADHPVIEVTLCILTAATAPTLHPLLAEPVEADSTSSCAA